jgi:hypothetical protein
MQHLRDLLDREIETLAIQTNTVISANTAAASEWAFRFQTFGEAKLSEILLFGSEVGLGVPGVKQRKAGPFTAAKFEPPQREARYQRGMLQDANGRNFIPKPDLTRYYRRTRNCLWNGTTICQAPCRPIWHHSVKRGFGF